LAGGPGPLIHQCHRLALLGEAEADAAAIGVKCKMMKFGHVVSGCITKF